MSHPDPGSRWIVLASAALAAGTLLGVAWVSRTVPVPAAAPMEAIAPPAEVRPTREHAPRLDPVAASTAAPASVGQPVPPGVSAAQWAALQAEMAARPDGAHELRRLADYLVWSDDLQRWRAGRAAPQASAEHGALALRIEAGLEERLLQREVSATEARLIKTALLQARLPDAEQWGDALQRWQAAQPAGAFSQNPQQDPRQAEFQRQQAMLVAAWQAQPAATRDHQALTAQLEALRRSTYAPAGR